MMRAASLMLTVALLAGCGGGPRVNRALVAEVPASAMAPADAIDAHIAALGPVEAQRRSELRTAQGDERVLAIEARAAESAVKASKAAVKTARQSGDQSAISRARARLDADEAEVTRLSAAHDRARRRVGVVEAQVALIEAQRDVLEAEQQLRLGEAVDAEVEPYDLTPLRAALATAEERHERARERLAEAEAKLRAAGGTPSSTVQPVPRSETTAASRSRQDVAPESAEAVDTPPTSEPTVREPSQQRTEESIREEEMRALAATRVDGDPEPVLSVPANAATSEQAIARASQEAARARGETPASVSAVTGSTRTTPREPTLEDWLEVLHQAEQARAGDEPQRR